LLLLRCVAAELNTNFADDVLSRVPKGEVLLLILNDFAAPQRPKYHQHELWFEAKQGCMHLTDHWQYTVPSHLQHVCFFLDSALLSPWLSN
jgi:hypothetical protein